MGTQYSDLPIYIQTQKRGELDGKIKKALIEMLKNSQIEYYDKKSISKKLYSQKSIQYQKKLVKITRELALLQSETKNN